MKWRHELKRREQTAYNGKINRDGSGAVSDAWQATLQFSESVNYATTDPRGGGGGGLLPGMEYKPASPYNLEASCGHAGSASNGHDVTDNVHLPAQ